MTSTPTSFLPPGPGRWALDRSHYPGGTTPIAQWWIESSMQAGMAKVFAELGTPAQTLQARFVNGFMYTRLRPLIAPDKPSTRVPPRIVLKIATRVHPTFRARRAAAVAALRDRPWLGIAERWEHELKPELVRRNLDFQSVDVRALDDSALQHHLTELLEHCRRQLEVHFWLHGYDLGPLANYVHSCIEWGIPGGEALTALAGASPSTALPARRLGALRAMVEAGGTAPRTLEDVRLVSAEAAALLGEHLQHNGHRLVTRYDIDGLTLHEMPGVVLSSILGAPTSTVELDHAAIASALRARVAAGSRTEFDQLLSDARRVMDVRDDNGPNTYEWPAGLFRRALLEAGRRLAASSRLHEVDHVFEVDHVEVQDLFGASLPGPDEMRTRHEQRVRNAELTPPQALGPLEPAPPLDVLPAPLPRMVAMVQTALEQLGMAPAVPGADGLTGAGIGTSTHRGRVRRATSPEEAIETMEPGDVLVVRATSPAFNAVLAIAGAIVTADGGPMSHAAVLARELGIPAVVGASGALALPDGATVEVDAAAGRVRIVSS